MGLIEKYQAKITMLWRDDVIADLQTTASEILGEIQKISPTEHPMEIFRKVEKIIQSKMGGCDVKKT